MRLSEYVQRRNGVPLGASNSLRNMLYRSLGAGSFSLFWKYWNPIWGFYLGKLIFKPLKEILSPAISLILTFVFSGLLHDSVIMLVKWKLTLILTPWFLLMGLWVVISEYFKFDFTKYTWIIRAFINILVIGGCYILGKQLAI